MSNRVFFKSHPCVHVTCRDCGWEYDGANGVGLAAKHCDKYGHTVDWDSTLSGTYTQNGSETYKRITEIIEEKKQLKNA